MYSYLLDNIIGHHRERLSPLGVERLKEMNFTFYQVYLSISQSII